VVLDGKKRCWLQDPSRKREKMSSGENEGLSNVTQMRQTEENRETGREMGWPPTARWGGKSEEKKKATRKDSTTTRSSD